MKYQKFERLYLVLPKHNTKAREKQMSIPRGEILDTLTLYREEITPAIAEQMLKHANPGNRRISQATVKAYANDMLRGNWDANSVTPIVFDSTGMLVDGHQRLRAVVDSNSSIITYIAENADLSFKYDLGRTRSVNNILQMQGVTDVSNNATAMIRTIGAFCFGVSKVSVGETQKAYAVDGDTIAEINRIAGRGSWKRALLKASAFTAAMYCAHMCGVSFDVLEEFAQVVNSGLQNNANQGAAVVLRNQIINYSSAGSRFDRKLFFLCTQEAIKDFSNGTNRRNAYTGRTAMYSAEFVEAFRAGTLYGDKL